MPRSCTFLLAVAAALTVWIAPALALDRSPSPGVPASAVTHAADLDRPIYGRRYRGLGSWHWRNRAAYTRWLHNEYVVAGYPVNQYRSPTYYWVYPCCYPYRHW